MRNSLSTLKSGLRHADIGTPAARPVVSSRLHGSIVREAIGMWLATRLAFAVFTYFAVLFNAQGAFGKLSLRHYPPGALLSAWNHWDTGWYLGIATTGYTDRHTIGFFPLYPLLIRAVAVVIGQAHVLAAALLVSNLATLGAFIALGLLAGDEYGEDSARPAIRAAAAYPLAFFTAAGYSDSLLLALAAFSLLFARRGVWTWAVVCAFLAGLTRLFAVVLILPLLWEYGRQRYRPGTPLSHLVSLRTLGGAVAVGMAVPLALAAWAVYLWARFGDPFGYLTAQRRYWGHESVVPWKTVQLAVHALLVSPNWSFVQARVLVDLIPVLAAIVLTVLAARRMPASFLLYMVGLLLLLLSSAVPLDFDPLNGEGRYLIIAAPIFLVLGTWMARRPSLDLVVTAGGFMLQGLLTAFFLRGGWLV